jgi:hypothetical protein
MTIQLRSSIIFDPIGEFNQTNLTAYTIFSLNFKNLKNGDNAE